MLRLLLTPRWMGWTLFALAAVLVCGGMAWWQLVRAESPGGSLLNAGYAFQWPLFGLFFAALWWRMLRAEARALDEVRGEGATSEDGTPEDATSEDVLAGDGPPVRSRAARPEPVRAASADSPFGPRPAVHAGPAEGTDAVPSPERARWNAMYAELSARERARNTPNEETEPS